MARFVGFPMEATVSWPRHFANDVEAGPLYEASALGFAWARNPFRANIILDAASTLAIQWSLAIALTQ